MKFLLFLGFVNAVKYRDCGTTGVELIAVNVSPCSTEPCELYHGESYSIDIHFAENEPDEMSLELCGYVGPVCVPFPIKAPAQKVTPGENVFSLTMPIEPAYPSMKVVGKIVLKSKMTDNKVCFMLPLKIMPETKLPRLATIFEPLKESVKKAEDKWNKVLKKIDVEILDQL